MGVRKERLGGRKHIVSVCAHIYEHMYVHIEERYLSMQHAEEMLG